ncbi:MAG TPA: hypothetical protein VE084_00910 [Burkholderiaceae bacterium]|nr:hypothetical protein [Burkholderiaceae bacterium]
MPSPDAALLSPDHIALIDKGVSAIVASRDAGLRPSLMRAVGATISADGREVTVFVSRSQSRQLLLDIAAAGEVAVVFSQPLSHRTVQLKGRRATLRPADDADGPALRRYLASMEEEIGAVGFGPPFVHAMFAHRLDDLVAIGFTPAEAYDQTPGPRAGTALPHPA